jgi:hypothetical protein
MRYAIVSTVFVITALSTLAQTPAIPPDRLTLERLQLRTDWTANIPVANSQDGIVRVQIADQGQVFVQTKAGILVALDSNTGRTLWKYKYPNNHASGFPIAWNDSHVFAINVAKLFCFDRFRGSLEFEYVMNGSPMTGPIADSENIYLPQSGMKVQAYKIPRELTVMRWLASPVPVSITLSIWRIRLLIAMPVTCIRQSPGPRSTGSTFPRLIATATVKGMPTIAHLPL